MYIHVVQDSMMYIHVVQDSMDHIIGVTLLQTIVVRHGLTLAIKGGDYT